MFCQNCGKDCGEDRCGMQRTDYVINENAESTDNFLQNTSVVQKQFVVKEERKKTGLFPKPPFIIKKVPWGSIEFDENSVKIIVKLPRVSLKDLRIPYNEVFDVSYISATKWLNGFLCVREWKDRHIPLPKRFLDKKLGDSMIWFKKDDNHAFYSAYIFLKQCAAYNAKHKDN